MYTWGGDGYALVPRACATVQEKVHGVQCHSCPNVRRISRCHPRVHASFATSPGHGTGAHGGAPCDTPLSARRIPPTELRCILGHMCRLKGGSEPPNLAIFCSKFAIILGTGHYPMFVSPQVSMTVKNFLCSKTVPNYNIISPKIRTEK